MSLSTSVLARSWQSWGQAALVRYSNSCKYKLETCLLDILAGRKFGKGWEICGTVDFNQGPIEKIHGAYLLQDDNLIDRHCRERELTCTGTLTLQETLEYIPGHCKLLILIRYAASLRLRGTTSKERCNIIKKTIQSLGLDHVARTRLGNCSGGERRRASICVELLSNPSILFLGIHSESPLANNR